MERKRERKRIHRLPLFRGVAGHIAGCQRDGILDDDDGGVTATVAAVVLLRHWLLEEESRQHHHHAACSIWTRHRGTQQYDDTARRRRSKPSVRFQEAEVRNEAYSFTGVEILVWDCDQPRDVTRTRTRPYLVSLTLTLSLSVFLAPTVFLVLSLVIGSISCSLHIHSASTAHVRNARYRYHNARAISNFIYIGTYMHVRKVSASTEQNFTLVDKSFPLYFEERRDANGVLEVSLTISEKILGV